jgi:hypothetical protein
MRVNHKLKIYNIRFSPEKFAKTIDEKGAFWGTDMQGLMIGDLVEFERAKREILAQFSKE